jgi:hypothetical protein
VAAATGIPPTPVENPAVPDFPNPSDAAVMLASSSSIDAIVPRACCCAVAAIVKSLPNASEAS